MKKYLCLLLTSCLLIIGSSASAQHDSSFLELGRTKIRKDFAQTITIKGRDLENMPFARISDALEPYFNGILSRTTNTTFVVDGNFVNDVDAYSIYDIEEITLVQNALGQVNGVSGSDAIVLITTKRKQVASKGISIAGGSSLITRNYDGKSQKSTSNFYHQYHVSAWKNWRNIQIGASANFLRDAMPLEKSSAVEVRETTQLSRFRFNAWADVNLAPGHTLTARMNFVPQTVSQDNSFLASNYRSHNDISAKQTLLNPSLRLSNRFTKELLHELDISYVNANEPSTTVYAQEFLPPLTPTNSLSRIDMKVKEQNFLLRDRISYAATLGNWQITPAINFTYRSYKNRQNYNQVTYNGGQVTSMNTGMSRFNAESYVLTPTVDVSYKNVFHFGAGLSYKLKRDVTWDSSRAFPFVTTMVDILRLGNLNNPYSLKIFGSYSKSANFSDANFTQRDLISDQEPAASLPIYLPGPVLGSPYPQDRNNYNLQLGAVFSLPGDKVQFSYNYDNRKYVNLIYSLVNLGTGYIYRAQFPDFEYTGHRLGMSANVLDDSRVRWTTGFNATLYDYKVENEADYPGWFSLADRNNLKSRVTGGWTNRLQINKFSFGLDILHLFNEHRYMSGNPASGATYDKTNSFRINNIFVGYRSGINMWKNPLELYLVSRNPLETDNGYFPDRRQYFGAGFKLQF